MATSSTNVKPLDPESDSSARTALRRDWKSDNVPVPVPAHYPTGHGRKATRERGKALSSGSPFSPPSPSVTPTSPCPSENRITSRLGLMECPMRSAGTRPLPSSLRRRRWSFRTKTSQDPPTPSMADRRQAYPPGPEGTIMMFPGRTQFARFDITSCCDYTRFNHGKNPDPT